MPTVTIEGPSIEIDKKRELVRRISTIASDIYGIEHIIVLIHENPPENVGLMGQLILDKNKEKETN